MCRSGGLFCTDSVGVRCLMELCDLAVGDDEQGQVARQCGFFAEMQHRARLREQRERQQQRASAQAHARAVREAERWRREWERARAADARHAAAMSAFEAKEQARLHVEARESEVRLLNAELAHKVEDIGGILAAHPRRRRLCRSGVVEANGAASSLRPAGSHSGGFSYDRTCCDEGVDGWRGRGVDLHGNTSGRTAVYVLLGCCRSF